MLSQEHQAAAMGIIAQVKAAFGADSIARVERMASAYLGGQSRYFDMEGLTPGFLDPASSEEAGVIGREVARWLPALQREVRRLFPSSGELPIYPHHEFKRTISAWRSFVFLREGALIPGAFLGCPSTATILAGLWPHLAPSGDTIFSILEPGGAIPPHRDTGNTHVSLHIGLIVPPDCRLSVAGEERAWVEGEPLLFNYASTHAAWNRSDQHRAVLICDIWHPEVTPPERLALTALARLVKTPTAAQVGAA